MHSKVDYDAVAPSYDHRYRDFGFPGTLNALEEIVTRRPGLRVLEVGCGTGQWLALLRERSALVAGLDGSPGMLERARERLPGADLRHGSAERLPWPDAAFDLVLCNNALHHFPDKPGFVSEAARVLAPGGELLVIGFDPRAIERFCVYEYFEGTRATDEARCAPAAAVKSWLERSGLDRCTTREVERIRVRQEAGPMLARGGLDKHVISQLSLLTDADHARGLDRIRAAQARAEEQGETLWLEIDIGLYGVHGVRP
jgi:ubiquinone/menaquinone biosynthesis C-methylase UbiE